MDTKQRQNDNSGVGGSNGDLSLEKARLNEVEESLGKVYEERMKELERWRNYRAEVWFRDDIVEVINGLAWQIFPLDEENRVAYAEAILNSVVSGLDPEVSLDNLWRFLADNNCKVVRIEGGYLKFYSEFGFQIDLTPLTKPIVFEAQSRLYKIKEEIKARRIAEAKMVMEKTLAEVQKIKKN